MSIRACRRFLVGMVVLAAMSAASASALELPVAAGGDGVVRVDRDVVHGLLAAFLSARAGVLPAARVTFKSVEEVRPFVLPPGVTSCEIIPADPAIVGSRRVTLIFRVNGRVQANLALRAELEALAPVVVTARDLPRGAVLGPNDLRLVEKDITGLREPSRGIDGLVGKGLRRAIKAGEVLQEAMLATLPVVHRGELVVMTVRRGGLELTANGAACDNGGVGETIRVRNSSSQKEILARIAGPGKVEVEM